MTLENFNGSATVYESGMYAVLEREVGLGVTQLVYDGFSGLPGRIGRWSILGLWGLLTWGWGGSVSAADGDV